jgi:hypothetical protein
MQQGRPKVRYLPGTIKTSIPFHISTYKFLAENYPDIRAGQIEMGTKRQTNYQSDF